MELVGERWRPVLGYEGIYEVSDYGRVRGVDRIINCRDGRRLRVQGSMRALDSSAYADGRKTVQLSVGKRMRSYRVAALVLEAFVGPRPPGQEACHRDGNPTDDRLANLRWDTRSGNMQDTVRHGRHWQRAKTCCPQEHQLVAPNLVPGRERVGFRVCRACSHARAAEQRAAARGEPFVFREAADAAYQRIMTATA